MIRIPGGTFRMGSDKHYPEEAPVHRVTVDGFWVDKHPVTNRQFREFVRATGHKTFAEIPPGPQDPPPHALRRLAGVRPAAARGRSARLEPMVDVPQGRGLAPSRRPQEQHQRARQPPSRARDARRRTFLRKVGGQGPADRGRVEFAARGGLDDAEFAWGEEFTPGSKHMANTWQGEFPHHNRCDDGFARTSPVTAFPPSGYGVYDMIGNVWERTTDWYSPKHEADAAKACCIPENPRGGPEGASYDPCQPNIRIPRKVLKGGSHLCAPNYCRRYRPAARHAQPVDTSTSHIGFRCIAREGRTT
jgi:formylglycine-generating enzyme